MQDNPPPLPPLPDTEGIFTILSEDYAEAAGRLGTSDTQSNRRGLLRTLFAMVEGMAAAMSQTALAFHAAGVLKLTSEQAAILRDERRHSQIVYDWHSTASHSHSASRRG